MTSRLSSHRSAARQRSIHPAGNAIARWNSVNHNIQTRPTGNAYIDLLLTLQNDSGSDKNAITIDYDFGALLPANTTEGEDEGLAGQRA